MGNCQAIDAAALVIQHPTGRIERLYWPVPASEIMKLNPGHYVSLIIPLPVSGEENQDRKTVQFTRVKLLRPSDILQLGHAYRLVTTQEVMKVLREKKYAKAKQQQQQQQPELEKVSQMAPEKQNSECEAGQKLGKDNQVAIQERHWPRSVPINSAALRSKSWRPSLKSISELGS